MKKILLTLFTLSLIACNKVEPEKLPNPKLPIITAP